MPAVGRRPKVRVNYLADAQMLLHLARAIEADAHRPFAWRESIVSAIQKIATDLINAPE